MRILFVASEIFPMAKTGGLGDVAAALPAALRDAGIDVRLMMPAYPSALDSIRNASTLREPDLSLCTSRNTQLMLGATPDSGLPLYLVRDPGMFERPGEPYHDAGGAVWPDNAQRFALLCQAGAAVAGGAGAAWRPDVLHLNDWHTGLIPALAAARVPSVLTIHNAAYQEHLSPQDLIAFGVDDRRRDLHGAAPSFLSIGIADADYVTTVSPTYAAEIQTPAFGFGLEKLMAARSGRLRGILNGIDDKVWDPQRDPHLAAPYSVRDLSGKALCKQALLAEMGLTFSAERPLLACVSRLTIQKGLDVLLTCLPQVVVSGLGFILLGTGDAELEAGFSALAQRFPGETAVRLAYDEKHAHRIIAGADMFVMPSRFEPCGLNQMYSQRYGTVPIVHAVGGLTDTVRDAATAQEDQATGFSIRDLSEASLRGIILLAANRYQDSCAWRRLQRCGMQQDFSWSKPAEEYARIYEAALLAG